MILYFGIDLLKSGQYLRFYLTLGAEVAVIILTFFALRRRDRLMEEKRKKQKGDNLGGRTL